ncbi:methylated-DNA--[protein]-cysteine S-methyltransferase [Siminovitchia fortis]|uniref:methylated-DNA--[protein]-cysteine S-methyltransferase n=1 Tax=Siminovitchia fortis TaxID=254758 RepID=UPI001C92EAB0|nr:methylated-DNA--[protein]-cysteine S-methyltransferase [Siminovitchia fortis]
MIYEECDTKIGRLRFIFKENDGALQRILLTDDLWHSNYAGRVMKRSNELGKPVCRQIQEYLNGDRLQFNLPFELVGTPFQKQIWQALQTIPYGQTKSYSEIADSIGRPKAARAVGYANALNPLPLLFPCHRVIGKNKTLTGYAGGIEMKKQLLQIEGAII